MASREFGTCRGCGAEIEWALLNRKPHPFDTDPTANGDHMLVDSPSEPRTVAVRVPPERRKPGDRLVTSHFATCPDAGKFRKDKQA